MERLFGIRREDRTVTVLGTATLALLMAAHAMLETARDTLFLARLPASELPFAYLAIAALALLGARASQRLSGRFDQRGVLSITAAVGAAVTVGLRAFVVEGSTASLYAVYVWAGVLATVVVVQLWLALGSFVTVTQAKRVFAIVAAGGLFGATLGSALAERVVAHFAPHDLLVGAAALLLAAAATVRLHPARPPERETEAPGLGAEGGRVSLLRSQPYLRRLLLLVLVSTVALTGVDYVFKAVVAQSVPAAELGSYFARFYLVVNGVALVVQLGLSGWLLRELGVSRALLILPVLLLLGVAGVGVGAGLLGGAIFMSVLFLKGADGSLRHSVHRTSTEVLFLPLPASVRERFKGLIDALGQRGGQALASLGILGAVAVGAEPTHLVMAVGLMVTLWIALAIDIKAHYLDLFRGNLRAGAIDTKVQLSELDLHSLEALVAALNSDEDAEVLGALDLLQRHQRLNLIPALVLYHPAKAVVLRGLALLSASGRRDFLAVGRRLLTHDDGEVRAAALRAITAVEPDMGLLRELRGDPSPIVRATALVGMIAAGDGDPEELEASLGCYATREATEVRGALARAIAQSGDRRFLPILATMATDEPDPEVLAEVAAAMGALPDAAHLPYLLAMLTRGRARADARAALAALGPEALAYLDEALSDPSTPRPIRRHIPRTMHLFEPKAAAEVLLRHLETERDEAVQLKILRALGRLRSKTPSLRLDRKVLRAAVQRTLRGAVRNLAFRLATESAQASEPRRRTPGGELLRATFAQRESALLEHLFRLLGLLEPREDFALLHHALRRGDRRDRAGSRELLEYALDPEIRDAVLALVDDTDDLARLERATDALGYSPVRSDYEGRLVQMLDDPSEAVRSIAAYHIGELGLTGLVGELSSARRDGSGLYEEVVQRAIAMLGGAGDAQASEASHAR